MRPPTIPVAKPYVGAEEEAAVAEVLRSGWLTQGPRVAEFEARFAEYVGAAHAVAVTSCTTALHLTYLALGIGAGDEVVCPSHSFIASVNTVVHVGARPVFADVDGRTFNISPAAAAAAITPRTKAILAVHQVGMPADLTELGALARSHGLLLIEDAACAVGSLYRGAPIGRPHGVAAAFSFHPRKLVATGEGGMISTNDDALARRLRLLRHHGMTVTDLDRHRAAGRYLRESYAEVGYNFRLSDLQAAVGIVQLGRLPSMLERRRAQAARYDRLLAGLHGVETPFVPSDRVPNFQSYVIRLRGAGAAGRDRVLDALLERGITTRPGVMCAHREPPYASLGANLPVSEVLSDEGLVLPLYHELTDTDQDRVVDALHAVRAELPTAVA